MDIKEILTTLTLVIIILVIYYMSYFEKRKQDKLIKKMQDELKEGDKIITYSGLSGTIEKIDGERIILNTYPDSLKICIEKWAVAGIDDREFE